MQFPQAKGKIKSTLLLATSVLAGYGFGLQSQESRNTVTKVRLSNVVCSDCQAEATAVALAEETLAAAQAALADCLGEPPPPLPGHAVSQLVTILESQ